LIHTKNEDLILKLTDLASLGTVADCVPLLGENRSIVKLGLKQMEQTQWDGLRAILETTGSKPAFTSDTIGFQIGPRINASGRIDHPYWALQTLIGEGEDARQKSQKLEELNQERRDKTRQILEEAEAAVDLSQPLLIAAGKGWSSGIVGIIAGRLQEKYGKPTLIIEDRGDSLVGSARSLPGFHAVHALNSVSDLLVGYGGHEQAAGFHIKKENYEAFHARIQEYATEQFKKSPVELEIEIDFILNKGEINLEHCKKVESFSPFGQKNPAPIFQMEDVKIINVRAVGKEKQHLKFTLNFHGELIDGIAFYFGEYEEKFWDASSVLVQLEKNKWKDQVKPQLQLVDFA